MGSSVVARYPARMIAGSVEIRVTCSGELLDESKGQHKAGFRMGPGGKLIPSPLTVEAQVGDRTGRDTLQPLTGWWIYMLAA